MPYAESRRACNSRICYKAHSHPTFSIGAVDQGRSIFTGASGGSVSLSSGSVVFVPASRVHACNPASGTAWSYQMLHLDAAWIGAVRHEYAQEKSGAHFERIRIIDEPHVFARFCRLNAMLFSQADPYEKEVALIEFIGECDGALGLHIDEPVVPARVNSLLRPVLEFLHQEATPIVELAELARLAGISRYQLIRTFRTATGMTPHAWLLNRRVNLGRKRILAGENIAAVAYDLGFADQAHFQRVFKAHAGVTPGAFRA
nr:AraC family transcriptional regulator [Acidovorax delafieldii]